MGRKQLYNFVILLFAASNNARAQPCSAYRTLAAIHQKFASRWDKRLTQNISLSSPKAAEIGTPAEFDQLLKTFDLDCLNERLQDPDLFAVSKALLTGFQTYVSAGHEWLESVGKNGLPESFYDDKLYLSSQRPKILILDIGLIPVSNMANYLTVVDRTGKPITLLGPLSHSIQWDIGDLDSDPMGPEAHHFEVMLSFADGLKKLSVKIPFDESELPYLYPVKTWNSDELIQYYLNRDHLGYFETVSTHWTHLKYILEASSPSVVNLSGSFNNDDPAHYREFMNFIQSHPQTLFIFALNGKDPDVDSDQYAAPMPQKLVRGDGSRPANIINVTSGENFGNKFVDIALYSRSSSYSAPKIAALLYAVKEKFPDCLVKKTPRALLRKLAADEVLPSKIPLINLGKVDFESIRKACQ